ncbi:MAG: alanine racemase [Defluviitaleaceae bacterium]|nr:alanine racemase [Defluviitaleaceae bacterium]
MYPRLLINQEKFEANLAFAQKALKRSGVSFTFVTKCFCAMSKLSEISMPYVDSFGDTRADNLKILPNKPKIMMRLPMPDEAAAVVSNADMSLNSELETVAALDNAARAQGIVHGVIVMVDLGDLREGYFCVDEMLNAAAEIQKMKNIHIAGIGVNLSCFGGVIPEIWHMEQLIDHADKLEKLLGSKLNIVSGGNSSSLKFIFEGTMPRGINNLRIGEAILNGQDPSTGNFYSGMNNDVFTFECTVIEVKDKPSVPLGETGLNAFGKQPIVVRDRCVRRRAILAAGLQDVEPEGLTPLNPSHIVLGASSDHLIVDVHDGGEPLRVGSRLRFNCSYPAILRACTSEYVEKDFV